MPTSTTTIPVPIPDPQVFLTFAMEQQSDIQLYTFYLLLVAGIIEILSMCMYIYYWGFPINHTISLVRNGTYNLSNGDIIEYFPDPSDIDKITHINLSSNNITKIKDGISNYKNLKKLNLSNNDLVKIVKLDNLYITWLDLSNNNLESVDGLNNLPCLEHLNLSNNNLKSINGIEKLLDYKLKHLNVNSNDIESINFNVENSPITTLDASNNDISKINITGCAKFTHINLSNNKLEHIGNIGDCMDLENLNLSKNDFDQIDSLISLTKIKSLKVLDLTENNISPTDIESLRNQFKKHDNPHIDIKGPKVSKRKK